MPAQLNGLKAELEKFDGNSVCADPALCAYQEGSKTQINSRDIIPWDR